MRVKNLRGNRSWIVYVFLFTLFGLMGCSTRGTVWEDPTTRDIFAAVFYEKGLRDWIAVERVTTGREPEGRLVVKTGLLNRREERIVIQARVLFKYERMEIGCDKTDWKTIAYKPGAVTIYKTRAPRANVTRYTIEIRRKPE